MSCRTFAIGDIHGCNKTLGYLVNEILKIDAGDTLCFVGDFIDRGPDSKGVIERILKLQSSGVNMLMVSGNHEAMLLKAINDESDLSNWIVNGGLTTLLSYGISHPSELPTEHLAFFNNLPFFICTDEFTIVHAGIDSTLTDPFSSEGIEAMLWNRCDFIDPAKVPSRKIITGHTSLTLKVIRESLQGSFWRLDNGCVFSEDNSDLGHLVAVDVNTGELFLQKNID